MKAFLFFLLFSFCAHAESFDEALGGSLTYHVFSPPSFSEKYNYKLADNGSLIGNPLIGYRRVTIEKDEYVTKTILTGYNSIAEPIIGLMWSMGFTHGGFRSGIVYGFYFQDNSKMADKGIGIFALPQNGWAPIPVLGLELTQTFDISKNSYLLLNGLVGPILINATLGIGWRI